MPIGLVIASIHEKRDEFRKLLVAAGAPTHPQRAPAEEGVRAPFSASGNPAKTRGWREAPDEGRAHAPHAVVIASAAKPSTVQPPHRLFVAPLLAMTADAPLLPRAGEDVGEADRWSAGRLSARPARASFLLREKVALRSNAG